MKLKVEMAHPWDAQLITLRESDYTEACEWVPGADPALALAGSISISTGAFTVTDGPTVVAIAGYSVTEHMVHPWLMCSEKVNDHSREFLRMTRASLRGLIEQFPGKLVGNYCYRDNAAAKRFLGFLGFRWVPSPGNSKFDFFYLPTSCASTQ